jgi:hypothetical protein
LEFLDHPISETVPSGFAESGSIEEISALCIGQKLEHPVFSEHRIFLDLIRNLMLVVSNHSPLYFHHWKHVAQ